MSRLSRKARLLSLGGAGVLVVLLAVWVFAGGRGDPAGLAEVKATRSHFDVTIQSTGTVLPENRLEIKAPVAGRIEKVLVAEGEKVKKGQILAWMSSTERAALLDAANAKGGGEVERWKEFYKSTPILAPITGMVIQRNVEAGQSFTTQDAILVLSDRLTVKAQVDETDIAQVKRGQLAKIVLDAYSSQPIPSHVDQVAFDAKTVNSVTTYVVDVLPEQPPEFMRSGMTATVTFLVAQKENALLVPMAALKNDGGRPIVLAFDSKKGGKATPHVVEPGLSDGKRIEILSGLTDTDVVLIPKAAKLALDDMPGPDQGPPGGASDRQPGSTQ